MILDLAAGGQLTVPPNLVIVGTMNSVDRSVALVDYALRRRFAFVRVEPSPEVVTAVRSKSRLAPVAAAVLAAFNGWITERLDREHTIGHSFFLNPALTLDEVDALDRVWSLDVLPLLEEYFADSRHKAPSALRVLLTPHSAQQAGCRTARTKGCSWLVDLSRGRFVGHPPS